MEFYDIENVRRDANQDNLYDLFAPTFKGTNLYELSKYVVATEQEMRADLICESIFGDINYVDLICNLNEVDNPLNFMEGDEIIFAPASQVYLYRLNAPEVTESKNQLLNVNKSTKVDQNRKQYIEQNYNLPPNLLDVPTDPVRIQNNQIVIGGS